MFNILERTNYRGKKDISGCHGIGWGDMGRGEDIDYKEKAFFWVVEMFYVWTEVVVTNYTFVKALENCIP